MEKGSFVSWYTHHPNNVASILKAKTIKNLPVRRFLNSTFCNVFNGVKEIMNKNSPKNLFRAIHMLFFKRYIKYLLKDNIYFSLLLRS